VEFARENGGSQYGEQDEDPESYPVVHLNEHAPAVGGHLPALGEVFPAKLIECCPAVIASPAR
jgi:hypothetical protein